MATTDTIPNPIELDPVRFHSIQVQEEDVDDGLCARCQNFDIQAFTRAENRTRGYALQDVQSSATSTNTNHGCGFCSLLLRSVENVEQPKDMTQWELNPLRLPVNNNPDMYVHMTPCQDNVAPNPKNKTSAGPGLQANRLRTALADRFSEVLNASPHELCLVADPDSPAAHNNDITGRYLGSDPRSEGHFDTIRSWIQNCQNNHPKCKTTVSGVRISQDQTELPARCIHLSSSDGDSKIIARLAATEGLRGRYITVTHRWNEQAEKCKTTTDNLCQKQQPGGIDLSTLPKLFQDVFTIALQLDVQYVWIDSLCIIQVGDDGADWRKEAPRMAQYYQHSIFTVAGTKEDITGGVLQPYSDDAMPWGRDSDLVRLPYRSQDQTRTNGHFYVYKRQFPVVDDFWATVRQSKLFTRGWILQEWLLSKRIVWYTPRGLFLECHTDGPRTEYQERILVENAAPRLRSALQLKGLFYFDNSDILDFWYKTIEQYSTCELTFPDKDRIKAVAGMAKEVGRVLADRAGEVVMHDGLHHETYLAGLWLRDIHHGLLWEEDALAPRWSVAVAEAPSWSWASLMMVVRWPERDKEAERAFDVVGLCLTRQGVSGHQAEYAPERGGWAVQWPSGEGRPRRALFDPTNMSACLHIRGRLCTVHVRGYLGPEGNKKAAAATGYTNRPPSSQWRAICSPSRPEIIAGWASAERRLALIPGSNGMEGGIMCEDVGVAVRVLHVSTRFVRTGALIKRKDRVSDVLLVEEVDPRNHVYRRVGVGRIFDQNLVAELERAKKQVVRFV
ncbi:Heterokaryon incompatibility protein (HET) domain containing protein [Naviculisporaceae sp. PSN 640]